MVKRPAEVLQAELNHVLWVQEEAPRWDVSVLTLRGRGWAADV